MLGMSGVSAHHIAAQNASSSYMEHLDRGVVALPAQGQGIFVSWRMLGTDSKDVCFGVERDRKSVV